MNIHIVQHDIRTNRPEENLEWIKAELQSEGSKGAMLTVFPACTLCGAPLYASAGYTDLQKRAQAALQELVSMSEHRFKTRVSAMRLFLCRIAPSEPL